MASDAVKLATGIPELDAVLYGGLLKNRIHLIEGRPGTGKTTLGLRYLIEGVKKGDGCLYVSLSEAEDELRETAANHGWSLDGIEIVEMIPVPRTDSSSQTILLPTDRELSTLIDQVSERIVHSKAARVVIDSMVEIRLLAYDSSHYRRQVIALRQRLARAGVTVLLLDDITSDGREYELQSAAHGVITLEQLEHAFGSARRRLRVVKLRGGNFQSGWHDYTILTGEILVFPSLIAQEHHAPGEEIQISSGVKSLDALINGPLVAGSSTMVLGPAGVGKTTVALQYALSAVSAGHHVGYFNFDESETTLRSRLVASMGADETDDDSLTNSKPDTQEHLFHLRRVNPSRISPGEFIWSVRRLVEDHNARLVIIDSINSYLDVIREEKSLLRQMHELFSYLSNMNVLSIIVGAHSARIDTSKEPDALSIITDNIVSLRYYERDNVVCKAICVLKKRQGPHVRDICELVLTDDGIRVGKRIDSNDQTIGAASLEP